MKNVKKIPSFAGRAVQQGFTLLELLASMVVIGILLGGMYMVFGTGLGGSKAIVHGEQVTALLAGAKGLYPSPAYTGISANQLITAGKAPSNMVVGTGATATLNNPWGGAVTMAAGTYAGGAAGNAVVITDPNVPANECNGVVNFVAPSFNVIKIGATVVKDDSAGTVLTSTAVTTACAGGNVSIALTFT